MHRPSDLDKRNAASGFNGTVTLSRTDAPTDSTCLPSEASATLNGNAAAPYSVQVTTTAPSVAPPSVDRQWRPFDGLPILAMALVVALASMLLGSATHFQGAAAQWQRAHAIAVTFGFLLRAFTLINCGGSGTHNSITPPPSRGTQTGTYTLKVTAASGSASHKTQLTLIVNAAS